VRKALARSEPSARQSSVARASPKLGPFKSIIDEILAEDAKAPVKQRHFATRIFARLRDEHGYTGRYPQVQRYVQKQRGSLRETFVPMAHDPGRRVECDFGHIQVRFPDGARLVAVLLVTWSYSNCAFAIALPSEKTEAILEGMVRAFEFFGCVPRESWWDNPKTVARAILAGRQRLVHPRYGALCSHYSVEPHFCMPARGNEKPAVENRVKTLQRHWATPVPEVADLAALNAQLLQCSQSEPPQNLSCSRC
jgi:transposase